MEMLQKFAIFLVILTVLSVPMAAKAQNKVTEPPESALAVDTPAKSSSGLPIPRFVTLSSDKVFVRTGPALRYPIKWVYQRGNLPVEIVQEFDTWRKIRDMDGDDGWIHQSLLSGERSVIAKGEANVAVRKTNDENSRVIAWLEPNVVAAVEGCQGAWCEIEAMGYNGFAERKFLWGIYDSEDFD